MCGRIVLIDSYLVDQIHLKIKSKIFIMCLLQGIKEDLVCQVSAIFVFFLFFVNNFSHCDCLSHHKHVKTTVVTSVPVQKSCVVVQKQCRQFL